MRCAARDRCRRAVRLASQRLGPGRARHDVGVAVLVVVVGVVVLGGLVATVPDTAARSGGSERPSTGRPARREDSAAERVPPARHLGYGAPGQVGLGDSGEPSGAPPIPPTDGPRSRAAEVGGKKPAVAEERTPRQGGAHDHDGVPNGHSEVAETARGEPGEFVLSPNAEVDDSGLDIALAEPAGAATATQSRVLAAAGASDPPDASGPGDPCPADAPVRSFTIHAIKVDIVYNAYGQHDPKGVMYVLAENRDEVLQRVADAPQGTIKQPDPDATVPLVEPLTIRAHKGDCVDVTFVNELGQAASIHPTGMSYAPDGSDGKAVGENADSTAAGGETVAYRWYAAKKEAFSFADGANPVMHDDDETLQQHGLFGALIVEEPGTTWLDPKTGQALRSGTRAMIEDPDGPDFREFAVYYHDGADLRNADGSQPTWQHSDAEQSLYTLNYRGDPTGARLTPKDQCDPDCAVEPFFYSSWLHGDPGGGDLVFHANLGDPIKYRIVGGNNEEKHVHHQHGHRFKSDPADREARTIDSQTVSSGAAYSQSLVAGFGQFSTRPDMTFEEAFAEGGAGYVQGSPGDYIFHCHLFPHYASGMWSILRVHDKNTRDMPTAEDIQPLPDREPLPSPTAEEPGYPNFVPVDDVTFAEAKRMTDGGLAPKPPLSTEPVRQPTEQEETALDQADSPIVAGAPYANPCPSDAPMRTYDVAAFETDIVYNNDGDHDPQARVYALSSHEQAIRDGDKRPRPLTIRANVGDCLEITLHNNLQDAEDQDHELSMHVHFVGYDALGSDGVNLGFNYDEGAFPGESITYRWYADEQGTIFWHDHLSGFKSGMHGTWGALVVEPQGSEWLDPYTGEPIRAGTKAMIKDPNGENFREFVLHYQDWARTFDQAGNAIRGPFVNVPLEEQGVSGISYANAPLFNRTDDEPAHAFSSLAHADPLTPLLEAYPGDRVRMRVVQGSYEEAHTIEMNGVRWRAEPNDPGSQHIASQVIGVSEQFEARFDTPPKNPQDIRVQDFLYGSRPIDDLWMGQWGLLRVWGVEVPHLEPLPGEKPPTRKISQKKFDELMAGGLRPGNDVSPQPDNDTDPPEAPDPGDPCPDAAPTRTYDVVAFTRDLQLNGFGDHDPHGIMYATAADYEAIKDGTEQPEPMVLRAHVGDCVEVTLTNQLPQNMDQHTNHAEVPVDPGGDWPNANRVSLHSQLDGVEVQRSDGATVGVNWGQTVGPGESITYRWYVDETDKGTTLLKDMADVRSHPHHGAYGMLIVEPDGSQWFDSQTGDPIETGTRAVIEKPNGERFREYALLMTDGRYVINPDGTCPVPPVLGRDHPDAPCNQAHGEEEDHGFKDINYSAEPLPRRLDDDPREHLVFSSYIHGDPATPLLHAFTGDPVRFRVGVPADKPRGVTFHLAGHTWPQDFGEDLTPELGVRGEMAAGRTSDIVPNGGAGGTAQEPGDYIFQAMKLQNYVEGGLWGIFRVHEPDTAAPVLPLDQIGSS